MTTPDSAVDAVVLLSGGLDSATVLAIANADGRRCCALSFRYGQRHAIELEAAAKVAHQLGVVEHVIIDIDPTPLAGSSLTGGGPVPTGRDLDHDATIPSTYVPARNTIFLAMALGLAETRGASEIWLGVNARDYSGYPDCRPEFLIAFQEVANLATKAAVEGSPPRLRAPLIDLGKADIIRDGIALGVDYGLTTSCYDPNETGEACAICDSCQLRAKGFVEAGITDPTRYRAS